MVLVLVLPRVDTRRAREEAHDSDGRRPFRETVNVGCGSEGRECGRQRRIADF